MNVDKLLASELPICAKLLGLCIVKCNELLPNGLYRHLLEDRVAPYAIQLEAWQSGRPVPDENTLMFQRIPSHHYKTVYVLQDELFNCKIGISADPKARLRAYRSSHAGLKMACVMYGNKYTEEMLHILFQKKRLYSEWFALNARDLRLIRSIAAASPAL